MKVQEANTLRSENNALLQENERYRGLIETLLRHPAFTPFINDISKDPSVLGVPPQMQQQPQHHQQSVAPVQQQPQLHQPQQEEDVKPEFMNFDASQLQIPQQPPRQTERVGLAMIPENDFSKLNINSFQAMNFNNFNSVNAYAVTEVPKGPDPVDLLIESPVRLPQSRSASDDTSAATSTAFDCDMNVLLAKLDNTARKMKAPSGRPI